MLSIEQQLNTYFSKQAQLLPASPLVRFDQHLFTFSPIQDVEYLYTKQSNPDQYFKRQVCFRHVYPSDTVNPLATPLQVLYSYHDTQRQTPYQKLHTLLTNLLVNELGFSMADIYLIVPDIPNIIGGFKPLWPAHVMPIPATRLHCKLPFAGDHYYVKVVVKYHAGLVTVANFVLVAYDSKANNCLLDSVFYPERLTMLQQHALSLYEVAATQKLFTALGAVLPTKQLVHLTISELTAALTLLEQLPTVTGAKKHAYTVRRLIRNVLTELTAAEIDPQLIWDVFTHVSKLNAQQTASLQQELVSFTKSITQGERQLKKYVRQQPNLQVDSTLIDHIYASYGLPPVLAVKWLQAHKYTIAATILASITPSRNFAFNFDVTTNQYHDPLIYR